MSLILIHGDDDFLKERAAREEVASKLTEMVECFSEQEYLENLNYPANGKRSFILWNVDDVPSILPNGDDDLVVVAAKQALRDKRAKYIIDVQAPKKTYDGSDILRWILKEGQRFNIDLNRCASALFVSCGYCLRKISSEIEKISHIASSGSVVSPEEAKSVMCFSSTLTPEKVVSAICVGDPIRALAFSDKIQDSGNETGWILAYVHRHVLQHLKILRIQEKKLNKDATLKILQINSFLYGKIADQIGSWSKESLEKSFRSLCDADLAHKSGNSFLARSMLEYEITRLAEESKNAKGRRNKRN